MQKTLRTDVLKDMRYHNWKLKPDVENNDFKRLVDKVMNSNQSFVITGSGGSRKTTLLKQLQAELMEVLELDGIVRVIVRSVCKQFCSCLGAVYTRIRCRLTHWLFNKDYDQQIQMIQWLRDILFVFNL